MFQLDKQKYLDLVASQGVEMALTQLHRDTDGWEIEAFEGSKGWNPELWDQLKGVRDFSRELWQMALDQPSVAKKTETP